MIFDTSELRHVIKLNAISLLLANDPSILDCVLSENRETLNENYDLLSWSRTLPLQQRVLVKIALAIWTEKEPAIKLHQILQHLNDCQFECFWLAMETMRYGSLKACSRVTLKNAAVGFHVKSNDIG